MSWIFFWICSRFGLFSEWAKILKKKKTNDFKIIPKKRWIFCKLLWIFSPLGLKIQPLGLKIQSNLEKIQRFLLNSSKFICFFFFGISIFELLCRLIKRGQNADKFSKNFTRFSASEGTVVLLLLNFKYI